MAPGRPLVGDLSSLSRGPSRAEWTTGVLVRGEAADARKLGSWGDTQWATHESAATTPTRLVAAAPQPGLPSAPLLRPDAARPPLRLLPAGQRFPRVCRALSALPALRAPAAPHDAQRGQAHQRQPSGSRLSCVGQLQTKGAWTLKNPSKDLCHVIKRPLIRGPGTVVPGSWSELM